MKSILVVSFPISSNIWFQLAKSSSFLFWFDSTIQEFVWKNWKKKEFVRRRRLFCYVSRMCWIEWIPRIIDAFLIALGKNKNNVSRFAAGWFVFYLQSVLIDVFAISIDWLFLGWSLVAEESDSDILINSMSRLSWLYLRRSKINPPNSLEIPE